jgi:hypothetical protein
MSASEATTPKRKRRWLTCLGLIVGLLVLFGCWLMIGLSFNFSGQSPLQQLETSRSRWDATGIDDYKMTLGVGSYNFLGGLHLIIHDDQIVEVAEYNALGHMQVATPVSQTQAGEFVQSFAQHGNFPAELNDYTIDNLFDFAAEKLSSQATLPLVSWCNTINGDMFPLRYETVFNEVYGNLQRLRLTTCPRWDFGGGWMCGVTTHCSSSIRITDFELLP